ncbi:MAG: signal peptidase II [Candidatus Bostrichicola ureolyticus]|nr:MAG: signal peptidase II [Candidatus Bostrichicola ureolyticus]
MKKFVLITLIIILIDQSLKIYIKTHLQLGDSIYIFPFFKFYFIENPGIAYGFNLGLGYIEKIIINIMRFIFIIILLWKIKTYTKYKKLIIPISLIFAGAIGNTIDSTLYGLIFNTGTIYDTIYNKWIGYDGLSKFSNHGYSFFMGGCVVDIFKLTLIDKYINIPFFGLKHFEIFKPIFNIADVSIFLGINTLIINYKYFDFFLKKIFNK